MTGQLNTSNSTADSILLPFKNKPLNKENNAIKVNPQPYGEYNNPFMQKLTASIVV